MSNGSRRSRWLIGAPFVVVLVFLGLSRVAPSRNQAEKQVAMAPSTTDLAVPPPTMPATGVLPESPNHGAKQERTPSDDATLSEAIPVETTGLFQKAYERWSGEPEDSKATREAVSVFTDAFERLDIHSLGQHIGCAAVLCRGRFRFTDLKELYKMTQIEDPDGIRVATTFPFEEGGTYSVAIYWTRNPDPTGPLTDTLGE